MILKLHITLSFAPVIVYIHAVFAAPYSKS